MRKNILFFADKLPPNYGGMESHAIYFIKHFSNHDQFYLRAIITKDEQQKDLLIENNTRVSIILKDYLLEINWNVDIVFFNSGRWIEELQTIRAILPAALMVYRTGGNEIIKAHLLGIKIAVHKERQSFWKNQINDNIDILITNSSYTENRLSSLGIDNSLFKKCVGGVDVEYIRNANKMPTTTGKSVFFCASRFVHYKNHKLLIQIFKDLYQEGYNFVLNLAGDGYLLEEIKQQVQHAGMEKHVRFMGALLNHQVLDEMLCSDYYIQLSSEYEVEVEGGSYIHSEGMGRSILEAVSCNLFVITTNTGALHEIITEDRGILVDINSYADVYEKIKNSIGNNRVRELTPIEIYSWEQYFYNYEKLFL